MFGYFTEEELENIRKSLWQNNARNEQDYKLVKCSDGVFRPESYENEWEAMNCD